MRPPYPPPPRADLNDALPQAARAHLLISRGQIQQAQSLIRVLEARYPGHPDLEALRAEMLQAQAEEKEAGRRGRDLRYTLGLNTGWRRFCWAVGCVALAVYSVYAVLPAMATAARGGLGASLTTMVSTGSRYSRHLEPWTRPAWFDFVYCGALLAASIVGAFLLVRACRGAADWEEMDVSYEDGGWRRSSWLDILRWW